VKYQSNLGSNEQTLIVAVTYGSSDDGSMDLASSRPFRVLAPALRLRSRRQNRRYVICVRTEAVLIDGILSEFSSLLNKLQATILGHDKLALFSGCG
jgi:hypothetical protein